MGFFPHPKSSHDPQFVRDYFAPTPKAKWQSRRIRKGKRGEWDKVHNV